MQTSSLNYNLLDMHKNMILVLQNKILRVKRLWHNSYSVFEKPEHLSLVEDVSDI